MDDYKLFWRMFQCGALHRNQRVCSLLMLQYFPKPKLDHSLFNPAHESCCDSVEYLLRKDTVELTFIIYGSDPF